jgi:hypothetical protein
MKKIERKDKKKKNKSFVGRLPHFWPSLSSSPRAPAQVSTPHRARTNDRRAREASNRARALKQSLSGGGVCQARYTASLAITTPRTRGLTDPRGRGVGFRLPRAGSHPAPTNLPRSSRDSSTDQTNAPTAGTHDAVTHPADTYTWALSVSSIYLNYLAL